MPEGVTSVDSSQEGRQPLLEVHELKKYFPIQRGMLRRTVGHVKAVDRVSFTVNPGETLGLVGESGCGKTTLGRCILRLYEPNGGKILLRDGETLLSVTELDRKGMDIFRRRTQIIFQDPFSSLNPRMTVLDIVGEPLAVNGIAKGKALQDRVAEVLLQVGLKAEHLSRYPHSFSGGQRQRIGVARALVINPKLVVADEPVSALDVSVQAQIANLLKSLQKKLGLTYIFISHDISIVKYTSDRIAVMYAGKLSEIGTVKTVLTVPRHPYTEALLSAIPHTSRRHRGKKNIPVGEPPDLSKLPLGCVFHPRCVYAETICRTDEPPLESVGPDHLSACHFAQRLTLKGIGQRRTPLAENGSERRAEK
jgi:peptide/nickel transport system ATP-binding protein